MEFIERLFRYRKSFFLWLFYIIVISSLYLTLTEYSLWQDWGVQSYGVHFTDLHVLLCSIDAYHNGYNAFLENPTCTWNIPHVYSRLWFYFHYVGFSDANRIYIGIFILAGVMGVTAIVLQNNVRYSIFFIISPVFLLAIERCNNDLVILLLLIVPLFLILKSNILSSFISHIFLIFLVALKYYPIACCIIFLFRRESIKKRLFHILLQIAFFTCWIMYIKNDLILQRNVIPNPGYSWSFGFNSLTSFLANLLSINIVIPYIILIVLTITYVAIVVKLLNRTMLYSFNNVYFVHKYIIPFIIGSSILCFCYFVRTSFDHRMVFLIFCIPLMLYNCDKVKNDKYLSNNMKIILILFLISSWMEFLCIWIVKLMKLLDYHYYIPNTLSLVRVAELLINHIVFSTLLALIVYFIIKAVLKTNYFKNNSEIFNFLRSNG